MRVSIKIYSTKRDRKITILENRLKEWHDLRGKLWIHKIDFDNLFDTAKHFFLTAKKEGVKIYPRHPGDRHIIEMIEKGEKK